MNCVLQPLWCVMKPSFCLCNDLENEILLLPFYVMPRWCSAVRNRLRDQLNCLAVVFRNSLQNSFKNSLKTEPETCSLGIPVSSKNGFCKLPKTSDVSLKTSKNKFQNLLTKLVFCGNCKQFKLRILYGQNWKKN